MNKRCFSIAVVLMVFASVVAAQETAIRIPAGSTIYEMNSTLSNGGTLVYQNDYLQISPNPACAGATCEDCGEFFISSIWTTGNARNISDDITLGPGPRSLVRYDFMVCGTMASPTSVDITSSLWTINASGVATDPPGAPIAGTSSTTNITVDSTFPCFIINVKPAPGILLPERLHLVITSSLQSTSTTGTYYTIFDPVEYGASANQIRRSLAGVVVPDPNDNADWGGAGQFSAAPNCPGLGANCVALPAGGNCAPYAAMWAHIYAEGNCGNGIVEPGEQCDGGACCQACQYAAAGSQCRAAATSCDAAELCDGMSDVCPPDAPAAAGSTCRASGGPCDPAEVCDGTSFDCPADVVITACADGDGCCPQGCDNSNDNDCAPVGVPTVSEWGLAILTLIGLAAGTLLFKRRVVQA